MVSQVSLLIFLSTLTYSKSQDCVLNSITKEDAWDKVLHRDIMKNYKSSEPPRNQSCGIVYLNLDLRTFSLDEYEGIFTVKMWTRMSWTDDRLTWLPDKYGGIRQIVVHNTEIWAPSLILLNSIDPDLYFVQFNECIVFSDGQIVCLPEIVYETYCSAKLRDWPYDIQECTLQFGNGDRFNVAKFRFEKGAMTFSPEGYANGWNIALTDTKVDPTPDVQLSISLSMERQAYGLIVILVGPCLIICILTTTSILLNVNDSVRLGLSCFSLINHFVFLMAIDEFLPKHSADTPVVLFFISGSLTLTISSVLVTHTLSKIVRRKNVPFGWVSSVSNEVFGSIARYLVFPRWHVKSDSVDVNVKNKEIWTNIASVLNSVYLAIVVIVYIGLFCAYMPRHSAARRAGHIRLAVITDILNGA